MMPQEDKHPNSPNRRVFREKNMHTVMKKAEPLASRAVPLRVTDAEEFLAKFKEARETGNADLAAALFTRDAQYVRTPFEEPIVGRQAIHDYWHAAAGQQQDIHFTVTNWFRDGYNLAAEWTCTYGDRSSGDRLEFAGMFIANFYGNQVRTFREYGLSRKL
jgi:SnoaL-like domain